MKPLQVFVRASLTEPARLQTERMDIAVFTRAKSEDGNEDAIAVFADGDSMVVAVADGMGGEPRGGDASALAIRTLRSKLTRKALPVRERLLSAFESANTKVVELRSGSTLAVFECHRSHARTYHSGDSSILVATKDGHLKHYTVPHSPTGYAVESGMLSEDEAMDHAERHLVSNMLGSRHMTTEVGVRIKLALTDTVVLGSDGLFDNLSTEEILTSVARGSLMAAAESLRDTALARMAGTVPGPSKPDDLSFVLLRRRRPRVRRSTQAPPKIPAPE